MEPDVSFVGVKLLPGKLTKVPGNRNPDSSIWTIHITQFALAAGAKSGKNTITLVEDSGDSYVLGTLERDRCEQFQGDFMMSHEFQLLNHGKSEVHLTGYQTTTDIMDPEAEIESDDEEEEIDPTILGRPRLAAMKAAEMGANGLPDAEDSEEDEDFDAEDEVMEEDDDIIDDEEDDIEAPEAIPLAKAAKLQKALKQGKKIVAEPEDDDSDSQELDDEEDELLAEAALQTDDDDEEEGEEEEEDEEDEDDEEEDSEVDLENPDDEVEEAELQRASNILKQQKRSAEAGKTTPQPNKKAKLETPSPAVADGDKQWSTAIKAHLAKEGPTLLSSLGSSVKKPPGVSRKLKKMLEEDKGFSIDSKGVVSLSK